MALPDGKHVMLSYNWDSKDVVIRVYEELVKNGIKPWMDVQGGIKDILYKDMAAGVENATVFCCFMTPEYQVSDNCLLELRYAAKKKIRIIPCMLGDKNDKEWQPSGDLGILTAPLIYIKMRDQSEPNILVKTAELISRITNPTIDQHQISSSKSSDFFISIRREYIENSFIHRIVNEDRYFPIEQSYINLAIVKSEEQKDKEKKLLQAEHKDAIIGTFEEIHGTKTAIDVKDLFEKCKDATKKILVLGRAGIGKSTFCQYVTYQWARGEIWTQYQLVILIKLRMLTKDRYPSDHHYSPFDLLKEEYASRLTVEEENRSSFEEQCKKGQVLWLLDGYDEFVQNIPQQLQKVFDLILNTYHHILTSRPYSIKVPYDVKMEITGFTDDNIAKYIEQFFTQISDQLAEAASKGQELKSFLQSNPNIWGISHIPVNLELICCLWGDMDRSRKKILTMTGLYDNITEWLLRLYCLKQKNLPQTDVDEMSVKEVDECCQKELMFLEALAFNAMESSTLVLQISSIEQALANMNVTVEDKKRMFNVGFLKPFDGKATGNQSQAKKEYYFVHLSFQEYFAARYLVHNLSSSADKHSIDFIRHNKYNQRYTLVFVFASGLLAEKHLPSARNTFWNTLFEQPVDLVGFRHMQILVSCLEEVSDKSEVPQYDTIIKSVIQWIKYVVSHVSSTIFQQLQDSLKRSIALSREAIIRDHLMHLLKRSNSDAQERIWPFISALSTYPVHPEYLALLMSALNDGNWYIRYRACYALGTMGEKAATSEVINNLVGALNDENEDVRYCACQALTAMGEKAATSEVISNLVGALNDENEYVRFCACQALGEMGEKAATSEVISKLVGAVNDGNEDVRKSACDALGAMGEKAATSEVISKLVGALNDENWGVRRCACQALGAMGEKARTSEVISTLVSVALNDENEYVRESAFYALGAMGEKAATSEVITKLLSTLDTFDGNQMLDVTNFLEKISVSFMVLRQLTPDIVKKLWSCIKGNRLKNLGFIPAEASIQVYLDTTWPAWLSVAARLTLLQGAAVTIKDHTIVVYGSKEPVELPWNDRKLVDKLVRAFSKQAKELELPWVSLRRKRRRLACIPFQCLH